MTKKSTKKSTDLKMSTVKKSVSKYKEKATYELHDGSTLTFTPYFRPSKIEDMLETMAFNLTLAQEKGIEISEKFLYQYIHFLTIKEFTHLSKEIADDFETQIQQMEWLIDSGYYKEIIEEAFIPSELSKVLDKMTDLASQFVVLDKLTNEMYEKAQKLEIKNKEIFEQLGNVNIENKVVQ